MSLNKLLGKLGFLVLVLALLGSTAYAQKLDKVYVDITNGNDVTNSGANPDNSVLNQGPVKTIATALTKVADNGTISIAASTTGLYEYTANINAGKSLTIEARVQGTFTKVSINALTMNQADQTITLTSDGTAVFEVGTSVNATAGVINVSTANLLETASGATINVVAGVGSISGVSIKNGSNTNLVYTGSKDATAGIESALGNLGTGTITMNNTAGTVTFPNSIELDGIAVNSNGSLRITGNVTLGANDITLPNATTGGLTIDGNLNFEIKDGAPAANLIGQILNDSNGPVTVSGTTTWSNGAKAARDFTPHYLINNNVGANTGDISMGPIVLNSVKYKVEVAMINQGTGGDLKIGSVSSPVTEDSGNKYYTELEVTNNSVGEMTLSGDVKGFATNQSTGKLTFGGATTVDLLVTNTTTGVINMNGATTLKTGLTFTNGGTLNVNESSVIEKSSVARAAGTPKITIAENKTLTLDAKDGAITHTLTGVTQDGKGTLVLAATSGSNTLNGAVQFSNVNVASGTATFGTTSAFIATGNVTVAANTNLNGQGADQSVGGNLTLSGGTLAITPDNVARKLTVSGKFIQTGGVFDFITAGSAYTLDVKGDFDRTAGQFQEISADFTLSLSAAGAQAFNPGATMKVGNLTFNSPTNTITVSNSVEVLGLAQTTQYTTVALGGNNVTMIGNGTTTAGLSTFKNVGTYTQTGGGGILFRGDGGFLEGTSPFGNITVALSVDNAANDVDVNTDDVKFTGQLVLNVGGINIGAGRDLSPSGSSATVIRNVSATNSDIAGAGAFNGSSTLYNLEYIGAASVTVGSEYTNKVRDLKISLTGNNTITMNAAANVIEGDLTIVKTALLNTGTSLELKKAKGAHTILGAVTVNKLIVSGDSSTVTGGSTTDVATLAALDLTSKKLVTVTGLNGIGLISTTADAIATLAVNKDKKVAGLTLGGASFTLMSDVISTAIVNLDKGTLNLGAYNLTIEGGGYDLDANTTVASTGGAVIITTAGQPADHDAVAIPYLTVNAQTLTLADDLTVSKNLYLKGATAKLAGAFNVNILDAMTSEATGNAPDIAGDLTFKGTTITLAADLEVVDLTVNSDTNKVATIITSNESAKTPTARTITVTDEFIQTIGNLDMNRNHLKLTRLTGAGDAYSRTMGNISQTSGIMEFAGATSQAFNPGTDWSIKNLKVNIAGVANNLTTDDKKAFTVTGTLTLADGQIVTNSAGELHLADGATIDITGSKSVLSQVPTFDNKVNVTYQDGPTGKELPTADTTLTNLTIKGNTALAANVTVNGKLVLGGGIFDITTNSKSVTIADSATVERQATAATINAAPSVTSYDLIYSGNTNAEGNEWVDGKINTLIIGKNATFNGLTKDKTIGDLDLTAEGSKIDANGKNLTVTGNLNMDKGTVTNTASLTLGGTAKQTITVPSAGYKTASAITLNNKAGFELKGGNLQLDDGITGTSVNLIFKNGVLTTGDNMVLLDHSPVSQGFDHSGVADTNASHINGNVKHAITVGAGSPTVYANGRYEFPVGSLTDWRPYILTFSKDYPAISPTSLVVTHVDERPTGTDGFPIGEIGNYPDFQWKVKATPSSFTNTQLFDLEVRGTNLGYPYDSDQNLRIIRRQDGSSQGNTWERQGADTGEGNYTVITGTGATADTSVVVRTTSSKGGITTDGTIFTIGMPQQAPKFVSPTWTDTTMYADSTLLVQFTAQPQVVGSTVSYKLKEGSASFAALNETSGLVTLTPKEADINNAPYAVTVIATDGEGLSSEKVITVKVTATPVVLAFTSVIDDTTAKAGQEFSFQYAAKGGDGTYSYSIVSVGGTASDTASITSAGLLTWTPKAADAGKVSVLTVQVKSGTDSVTTVDSITVVTNSAPSWAAAGASFLPDTTVYLGDTLKWTYKAIDPDGDVVSYAFGSNFPENEASLDANSGEFVWIPKTASAFPVIVPVYAKDGEDSTLTEARVTIKVITVAVSGTVKYNVTNAAIANAVVSLKDSEGKVVATDSTDASGKYIFAAVTAGEYTVTASKTSGYVLPMASDALMIQKVDLGTDTLDTKLQVTAADVDQSGGTPDAIDAQLVLNRSVDNKLGGFTLEDWVFESKAIKVTSAGATQDLMGICAGDALSDASISGAAKAAVSFDNTEIQKIKKSAEFKLPVSVKGANEVGSYTLRLKYPSDQLEFTGVVGAGIVSNVDGDVISLAWANANKPLELDEEGVLAQLKFKAVEGFEKGSEAALELLEGSEITDASAKTLASTVAISSVTVGIPESFDLGQNYPNPFNPTTTIKYGLPANGKVNITVFNTLGQIVETLVDTKQEAGEYEVKFNAQSMASGVYLYRIIVTGGAKDFVQTKKMLLLK